MLELNVRNDEELKDVLNSLISALLPHEGYNSAGYSRILNHILNYINLEEFDMEYYALIKALFKLDQINISNADFKTSEPPTESSILSVTSKALSFLRF